MPIFNTSILGADLFRGPHRRSDAIKERVLDELRAHTGNDPNPDMISASGSELCCCCGHTTGVQALQPVTLRSRYVDGVGQFCSRCWQSSFGLI